MSSANMGGIASVASRCFHGHAGLDSRSDIGLRTPLSGRPHPWHLGAAETGLDAFFGEGRLVRHTICHMLPASPRAPAWNQNRIRSWHQNQNQTQTQNDAYTAATFKPCEPAGGLLARPPRRAQLFSLPGRSTPALSAREGTHGLPIFWLRDNYWSTMRSSLRTTATM